MSLSQLQNYIETTFPSTCVKVDLLKTAENACSHGADVDNRSFQTGHHPEFRSSQPFSLAIDGECCLNRLYGGYLGDWVCGGEWNRMFDFLASFTHNLENNNIVITVFFDGTLNSGRMKEWILAQKADEQKMANITKHLSIKGTPPPKTWWVPPNCLRTSLRMALRQLQVNVIVSVEDHHREIMNYIWEHRYHGLVADDSEYIVFNPPRYFSSKSLKMTFSRRIQTKEYVMKEIAKSLSLHPNRYCLIASLLTNHIMSEKDLSNFHRSLCPNVKGELSANVVIKSVVNFVRNLTSVDDLDYISSLVFGDGHSEVKNKFKNCVRYYSMKSETPGSIGMCQNQLLQQGENSKCLMTESVLSTKSVFNQPVPKIDPEGGSVAKLNETGDGLSSTSSLQSYRQLLGDCDPGSFSQIFSFKCEVSSDCASFGSDENMGSSHDEFFIGSSTTAIKSENPDLETGISDMTLNLQPKIGKIPPNTKFPLTRCDDPANTVPTVSIEVMRLARERHRIGVMYPGIYQVLSLGEYRIPHAFEDTGDRELPSASLFYRPLRQMVYAVLFNHHHLCYQAQQKKTKERKDVKPPPIVVKEWIWSESNKYRKADLVHSKPLGWAVPTVSRLWFGNGLDNERRLKAFLTCMRCSGGSLIRDTSYVPTQFIIPCCVLRYVVANPNFPVLREPELDAFLVQAVDPRMGIVHETEKIQLPVVNLRAVKLAALFMQGVENAIFANEACGAPVPWTVCCPWMFFDGKLFQETLLKASASKNLIDLCDGRINEVTLVERMRTAILEGVPVPFCPFPTFWLGTKSSDECEASGICKKMKDTRGGHLEVGGMVVSSWGSNNRRGSWQESSGEMISSPKCNAGTVRPNYHPAGIGLTHQTVRKVIPRQHPSNHVVSLFPQSSSNTASLFHTVGRGMTMEMGSQNFFDHQNINSPIDQSGFIQPYPPDDCMEH